MFDFVAAAAALFSFLLVMQASAVACQTPSGVPCFTLNYEQSVWALVKSPVRDVVTADLSGTMAIRQDGSFLHRVQPASRFSVRGSRDAAPPSVRLYLAGTRQMIASGPQVQADFRLPPLFFSEGVTRRTAVEGDSSCRAVVAGFGQTPEQTGKESLLGEPVVNWKIKTAYGDATVSVAPGLDCQVLRMEAIEYRYGYMPVRKELFEAKSLRQGEPAAALFALPKGTK